MSRKGKCRLKERKENQSPQAQTARSSPFQGAAPARRWWNSLNWWPALAGIALAAFVALDTPSGSEFAAILAASGLVYLGTAVLCKPSTAWPLFFGTFVVITAGRFGMLTLDATWIFLGVAALFAGYGLLHRAAHPIGGLPFQVIAWRDSGQPQRSR